MPDDQDLDSLFQDRQDSLVRAHFFSCLGVSGTVASDASAMPDMSGSPVHPLAHKHSFDQALQLRPWHQLLPELPLVTALAVRVSDLELILDAAVWFRNEWHGILVRSSTKVKDTHIADAELIKSTAQDCGLFLASLILIHPDEHYRRHAGALDPSALRHDSLNAAIKHMRYPLSRELPAIRQGLTENRTCMKRTCPHCSRLMAPMPEHSIYTLHKGGRVVSLLEDEGIIDLASIGNASPGALLELSPKHRIQLKALSTGQVQLDRTALGAFLSGLTFPMVCLDFECVSQALPPFEGIAPWEHVPFLASLYVLESRNDLEDLSPQRSLVLCGEPGLDARSDLAAGLVHHIPAGATILGYGTALEKAVLERLASWDPSCRKDLSAMKSRLVDVQTPFQEFWYYHPEQRGKTSLKKVLPLLSHHNYRESVLSNGGQAHLFWAALSDPAMLDPLGIESFNGDGAATRIGEIKDYAALDAMAIAAVLRGLWQVHEGA